MANPTNELFLAFSRAVFPNLLMIQSLELRRLELQIELRNAISDERKNELFEELRLVEVQLLMERRRLTDCHQQVVNRLNRINQLLEEGKSPDEVERIMRDEDWDLCKLLFQKIKFFLFSNLGQGVRVGQAHAA